MDLKSAEEAMWYSERKIAFVSNLHGSTALDCTFHSLFVCLVLVANRVIYNRMSVTGHWAILTIFNFVTISIPLILGVTLLADVIHWLCLACVFLILAAFCYLPKVERPLDLSTLWNTDASTCVADALADNRFVLFYGTTVGILAVDFTIFPRHLAKTELFGFSVMDVGVGLFGFYYGLFAREARVPPKYGDIYNFLKGTATTAPLWIIAFARLIAVKASGYPEHVTEYGVHWNFFFTLAFVRVTVSLVLFIFPFPRHIGFLSIILLVMYSWFISINGDFSNWLIHTPNDRRMLSLVEQNKEGIVSLPGFIALYFIGMQIGTIMHPVLFNSKEKITFFYCFSLMVKLLAASVACAGFSAVANSHIERCSRRLANLAYIFWLMFNFLLMLAVCLCGALLVLLYQVRVNGPRSILKTKTTGLRQSSLLLLPHAFNKNTLALFLLANIMTGIVNMSIKTIDVAAPIAFLILSMYCFFVSFVAAYLYTFKIILKFW